MEAELLYSSKGMVEPPDEELLIPLGKAEVKREGSDVSIICYSQTVPLALKVAAQLEEEDISAEILDLRSIKPLDEKSDLRFGSEDASRGDRRTRSSFLRSGRGSLLPNPEEHF